LLAFEGGCMGHNIAWGGLVVELHVMHPLRF